MVAIGIFNIPVVGQILLSHNPAYTPGVHSLATLPVSQKNETQSSSSNITIASKETNKPTVGESPLQAINPNCPIGTAAYLEEKSIMPTQTVSCTKRSLPITYEGTPLQAYVILYGSTRDVDLILPQEISVVAQPSGDLVDGDKILQLPALFEAAAALSAANMLGSENSQNYLEQNWQRFVRMRGTLVGPDSDGRFCANFTAVQPLEGTLQVYGIPGLTPTVTGDFSVTQGIMTIQAAEAIAEPFASQEYLQMGVDPKYLDITLDDWSYHVDTKQWILSYALEKNVISATFRTPNYNTRLVVMIGKDGSACLVDTVPYSEPRPNLQDQYSCVQ